MERNSLNIAHFQWNFNLLHFIRGKNSFMNEKRLIRQLFSRIWLLKRGRV
jgi:hypothetical protein